MPVFDFSSASEEKEAFVCTYTAFTSDSSEKTPDDPILVLDNQQKQWSHHSTGVFCNQSQWTAFEFKEEDETFRSNILRIDARFVNLIKWLGENRINVLLSGENRADGYAVYKIRENAFHGGTKLSAADGFLQYVMERLLSSSAPEQEDEDEELDESGDSMKLTSIQSISDFLNCAGRTMPDNIRLWARRNLAVARSSEVSAEERRHAQRALSIMTNIQWKNNYFEAIELSDEYSIVDMAVPSNWAGKTLEQLNIRSRYGISIIGIRGLEETNVNPSASYALHPQDVLIVLGHNTEIQKLREMKE